MHMGLSKLRGLVLDSGAWRAAVHGFAKSQTRLSDLTTTATGKVELPSPEMEKTADSRSQTVELRSLV